METAHQNFISNSSGVCKALLDDIQGKLEQFNVLWAGEADYHTLITQAEIDSVPAYVGAGLTKAQLDNAQFALAQVMTAVNNALPSITMMANLP